jgi:hypothetical protein
MKFSPFFKKKFSCRCSVYQDINTSVHQYINKSIHQYISTSIHQSINTSVHQYIGTSIHQYINTSIHQYSNTSVHQYISQYIHGRLWNQKIPYHIQTPCHRIIKWATCIQSTSQEIISILMLSIYLYLLRIIILYPIYPAFQFKTLDFSCISHPFILAFNTVTIFEDSFTIITNKMQRYTIYSFL